MATFSIGFNQPAGFAPGQINDGASIGTFVLGNFSGNADALCDIRLRLASNGKLIALVQITKSDGTVIANENLTIKQREYFSNLYNDYLKTKSPAFQSIQALVATQAELTALGLVPDGQMPNAASGKLPYQQNADGSITAMPAIPGSNLNGPNGPGNPGPGPTPGALSKLPTWAKYALYAVVGAAVLYGGYVLVKMKKK